MPAMFSIEPRDASVFYVCSCVATLGMNGGVGKTVMFDRRDATCICWPACPATPLANLFTEPAPFSTMAKVCG